MSQLNILTWDRYVKDRLRHFSDAASLIEQRARTTFLSERNYYGSRWLESQLTAQGINLGDLLCYARQGSSAASQKLGAIGKDCAQSDRVPCRNSPPSSRASVFTFTRAGATEYGVKPPWRIKFAEMNSGNFRKPLAEYIRSQAKPPDKLSHQFRLYRLACRLAKNQAYDDHVLYAASWLHDLGVFIGHRPEEPASLAKWDHVAYAIDQAPKLLAEFGFPREKVPHVLEVISNHLPSRTPISIEGVLLRDADILEQLGAIGILRIVSKIGRDTRFVHFSDALRTLRLNLTELPSQLRLASARRLAKGRVKTLKLFLQAVQAEAREDEL